MLLDQMINKIMTYDRIDWHSGNNYPKDLPKDNGGTHIGMFLSWIINNNLIGDLHINSSENSLNQVKNRLMTGRNFLIKECDSKLWPEDLNHEGNLFAQYYYANDNDYGQYIDDYSIVFNKYETLYHVEDDWKNYDLIEPIITQRYNEWKQNK